MFFHFTHLGHLPKIIEAGRLLPTESNIGSPTEVYPPAGLDVGPRVVWLLDTDVAEGGGPDDMHHGLYADKRRVRFEVDVPAIRWLDWQWRFQMHPEWRSTFEHAGGGPEAVEHWYVWPNPIRSRRWVSVRDMETGESLLP